MAICAICNLEMTDNEVNTCKGGAVHDGKQWQERIPFVALAFEPNERCGDCNVGDGGYHHLGCDIELCPVCGDQFEYCDCSPKGLYR